MTPERSGDFLLPYGDMPEKRIDRDGGGDADTDRVLIEVPSAEDGSSLWKIARDSRRLDLNSSYAYLLWCRDFRETSLVARLDGSVVGFVAGYQRPGAEDTLMVWQVAVDERLRGHGLGAMLIDRLLRRLRPRGVRYLETTVTASNTASNRMFNSLAKRWRTRCRRSELFGSQAFPDDHETEFLYRIGPFEPVRDHVSV